MITISFIGGGGASGGELFVGAGSGSAGHVSFVFGPEDTADSIARRFEESVAGLKSYSGSEAAALFLPDVDFKIFSVRDPAFHDEPKTRKFVEWHIRNQKYFESFVFDYFPSAGNIFGLAVDRRTFDSAFSLCAKIKNPIKCVDVQIMREFAAVFAGPSPAVKNPGLLVKIMKKHIAALRCDADGHCESVFFSHDFDSLGPSRSGEGFGAEAVALVHEAVAKLRPLAGGRCDLRFVNASMGAVPYYFELHARGALNASAVRPDPAGGAAGLSPAEYPGFNLGAVGASVDEAGGERRPYAFNLLSERKEGGGAGASSLQKTLMALLVIANCAAFYFWSAALYAPSGPKSSAPSAKEGAPLPDDRALPPSARDALRSGGENIWPAIGCDLSTLRERLSDDPSGGLRVLERSHNAGIAVSSVSFSRADGGRFRVEGRARDEGAFVTFCDSVSSSPQIREFTFETRKDEARDPQAPGYPVVFTLKFKAGR